MKVFASLRVYDAFALVYLEVDVGPKLWEDYVFLELIKKYRASVV